jgi:hypothetical protein
MRPRWLAGQTGGVAKGVGGEMTTEYSRGSDAAQPRTLISALFTTLYSIGAARFAVEPQARP